MWTSSYLMINAVSLITSYLNRVNRKGIKYVQMPAKDVYLVN